MWYLSQVLSKLIVVIVSKSLAPLHHPLKQGLINAFLFKSIYGLISLVEMMYSDPNHPKAPYSMYYLPQVLSKLIVVMVSKSLAPLHHPLRQGLINVFLFKSIYGLSSLVEMMYSDPNHPKAPYSM